MQETQAQSPGEEDPLEEEMATHSSILAGKIPWTEVPGGLRSVRSQYQMQLRTHKEEYLGGQCSPSGPTSLLAQAGNGR